MKGGVMGDNFDHGPMRTDPTTERMRQETGHHCIACPSRVRDLAATAHNLLVRIDALREGSSVGDIREVYRKAEEMRSALASIQQIADEHFAALNAWRRP